MEQESREARDLRGGTAIRGFFIAGLIAAYGYFMQRPEASYTSTFLIAIALQLGLIVLKRFVPADQLPRIQYLFEMLADGVTVLLFALGVFGGIASMPREL